MVKHASYFFAMTLSVFALLSVFGCPTLKAVRGTTVKVKGVSAQVTCDATGESWQMNCRGSKWYGKASNCTTGEHDSSEISDSVLVQNNQRSHTYDFELIGFTHEMHWSRMRSPCCRQENPYWPTKLSDDRFERSYEIAFTTDTMT